MTLKIVPDMATAVQLFNEQSPRFAASLISSDDTEQHPRSSTPSIHHLSATG